MSRKKKTNKEKCFLSQKISQCRFCSQLKKKIKKNKKFKNWQKNFSKLNKKNLYYLVGLIAIAVILYNFRAQFIVATVNGQPILRTALIKEMEQQYGQRALESLLTKSLIYQEAKKQKITIPQEEIDQEIKTIEETLKQQGQDLDQLLSARSMSRQNLIEEVKLQKMIEKMASGDIEVSDEELTAALEQRQAALPEGTNPEEIEEMKEALREQLVQQKQTEQIQLWLQNIRTEAKVNYLLFEAPTSVVNQ